MTPRSTPHALWPWVLSMLLAGCAAWPWAQPVQVNLVGLEALPSEGLELRVAVKLRVQNPNDTAIDYDGIALNLALRGHDLASGVSDRAGSVPRFGEAVLVVPMSVSVTALLKQGFALASGESGPLDFVASGRLSGPGFLAVPFESRGTLQWPAALAATTGASGPQRP
jgi:LEA14-like dessication related protein